MRLFVVRRSPVTLLVTVWITLVSLMVSGNAQDAPVVEDIRRTPTVIVIEKTQPAVAAVYSFGDHGNSSGSGSVIDPRGYVLTAKHVVKQEHIVLLGGRPPLRASIVGTMPEYDVALLKLGQQAFNRPASPNFPRVALPPDFIQLGLDHEVRIGETVLNIGSPGGRGIVATQGIVSAVAFTGVNPLAIATQSATAFDELLQFDAASNPGNSGGPVINLLGQQIGMTVSGINTEEGIHFALPLKTLRHSIPAILNSELRHRFNSGLTVDPQLAQVIVTDVAQDSPAAAADIQVGDEITSVDGRALRDPIDWEFTRFDWRPEQQVMLGIQRGPTLFSASLKLAHRVGLPGVEVAATEPGLLCRYALYDPSNPQPLDDDQHPASPPIVIATVGPKPESLPRDDHYELAIDGLLKINESGVYRLGLASDDGSRLYLHDRLLIDNGGNHAANTRTNWADLQAGMHPIRIEFYEDEGQQELSLYIALGDAELTPVAAESLFHPVDPPAETPTAP